MHHSYDIPSQVNSIILEVRLFPLFKSQKESVNCRSILGCQWRNNNKIPPILMRSAKKVVPTKVHISLISVTNRSSGFTNKLVDL